MAEGPAAMHVPHALPPHSPCCHPGLAGHGQAARVGRERRARHGLTGKAVAVSRLTPV
jgi:hypothetical protein